MAVSFTDKFNLDKSVFRSTGAFDTILDVDSRVFIDPALLDTCTVIEFVGSRQKVEKYFSDVITLLSHSASANDMYWRKANKMLTFKELTGTCFGYSEIGTSGNSIGSTLRRGILQTIKELIDKGEKDPTLFELLGVFQERIGCDRISDFLTFILAEEIMTYTQRVVEFFGLSNCSVTFNGKNIQRISTSITNNHCCYYLLQY
jgi:hypothetical protein